MIDSRANQHNGRSFEDPTHLREMQLLALGKTEPEQVIHVGAASSALLRLGDPASLDVASLPGGHVAKTQASFQRKRQIKNFNELRLVGVRTEDVVG